MTHSASRKVLIDTDTASDDAVALIMALRSTSVEVLGITVVAGNVSVDQGTLNALYTVELCGSDVPVFAGAATPLVRALQPADWFHGKDGMSNHGFRPVRLPGAQPAVEAMIHLIETNPGIDILTLGPLTNLALVLIQRPDLAQHVGRCVVMGGAPCCEGNVTPAAEYNFWVDPEAARIVCRSQLLVELVGWQLSRGRAVVSKPEVAEILKLNTALARYAIHCNKTASDAYYTQTGEVGLALPDPVAMALFLDATIATSSSSHYLDVQIDGDLTRGMTVVDRLDVAGDERNRGVWSKLLADGRRQSIVWSIDIDKWKRALFAALA